MDTKEKRVDVVTDILLKTVYDKYMIQCSDEKNKRIVALEDLRNPKARATLRNSVKEYVKKNHLEEMSYGFIRDKLKTGKMTVDTNNIARNFMKSLHKTASAEKQMAK